MKNTLFVLLDGMEDHPNPELDNLKPYEAAEMPYMYSHAPHRMQTDGKGYTQLFLNEFFTGHPPETSRAALEAMGLGLNMKNGRAAYRLSPAVISPDRIHWSYNLDDETCETLKNHIMSNLDILDKYDPEIKFFIQGRSVLTMACDDIPDLPGPPADTDFKEVPGDLGKLVAKVAEELNGQTSYPWGCGKLEGLYPPYECISQMSVVSDSPTALGVCATLGHKIKLINEFEDRFEYAANELEHGNVFLHIDEVDEYSHQKDARKKIDILERTDRLMEKYFPDVERLVYFVDHGTSCVTGEHILMTVPFWTNIETGIEDGTHIPTARVIPELFRR